MIIEVESRSDIDCLIAILSLGLCTALESKHLSIREAEKLLFSPYKMRLLKEVKANPDLVDLVHLGTELENVERIIPQHLQKSLDEIKAIALSVLRSLPEEFNRCSVK